MVRLFAKDASAYLTPLNIQSLGIKVTTDFEFTPCCDEHDLCYERCGSVRDECDSEFSRCMKDICDTETDKVRR